MMRNKKKMLERLQIVIENNSFRTSIIKTVIVLIASNRALSIDLECPELSFYFFKLRGPTTYSLCLSVCLSVSPADSKLGKN